MSAMKQNWRGNATRGVAIAWVTIMIVVLMIVVGAILTLALGYFNRSVANNAKQQTYFTARSAIDAVTQELVSYPDGALSVALNEMEGPGSIALGMMTGKTELGDCSVRLIKGEDGTAYIEAVAVRGGQSDTVVGQLGLQKIADNYAPIGFGQVVFNNLEGKELVALRAVNGDLHLGERAGKDLILSSKGGASIFIDGNLYVHTNLSIEGTVTSDPPQIEKRIISEGNVMVAGNMQIGRKEEGVLDYPDSGIHTSGDITLQDGVKVFGNLTAQSVFIDTWSAEDEIIGTITAKTVIIEGNSNVLGAIVADQVEIRGNASFTGSITCGDLVIATDGDGTAIYGTTEPIQIPAPLKEEAQLKIENYETRFVQVAYQSVTLPEPVFPPESPPVMPDYTALDKSGLVEKIKTSGSTLGTTDGHDSYYRVTKKNLENLTVQGTGKVYLYVKSGVNLDLDEIEFMNPSVGMSDFRPHLFVILENGADVEVSGDFYGYLYGPGGSKMDVENGTHLYGGLYVEENGSHLNVGKSVTIEYVPPDTNSSDDESSDVKFLWYLRQYLPELPTSVEVSS